VIQGPGLRIFLSFGHLQMMLDAMPRLALEVWRYFMPAGKDERRTCARGPVQSPVMVPTASRLYLDVTGLLRVRRLQGVLLDLWRRAYQALVPGVSALVSRPEFHRRKSNSGAAWLRMAFRIRGR